MTCKDCLHRDVCRCDVYFVINEKEMKEIQLQDCDKVEDKCEHFKNKADVVEVKRGKWEEKTFIVFDSEIKLGYKCSECNTTWDTNTNYCSNCGAKMDGERKCDNG